MTKTLTVEGDITTVDAATALTTQGSVTAPSLVIPSGVSRIDKIIAAVAFDAGAAAGAATFFIRLGGAAVLRGEQTIAVAGGAAVVGGALDLPGVYCPPLVMEDVDIEVSPSDVIRIQGEMASQDVGTAYMVVTLVFA